jgi:hypothetical protein
MKVIFIVGLPCSGKTHLGQEMDGVFIDDISKRGLSTLPSSADLLIISDPFLCRKRDRFIAEQTIKEKYPDCEVDWIFFENAPDKCLKNMKRRFGDGDTRAVRGLVLLLSKEYTIPGQFEPKEVWDE